MDHIALSVLVPVYNVEKFVEKCVKSLFEQTLKDSIEFIFVNDASTDKSIEIIKKLLINYPERKKQVIFINHDFNRGLAATRLTALTKARGEYIIPCDSDDWVESNMYELLLLKAKKDSADIVICDYYEGNDKKEKRINQQIPCEKNRILDSIITGKINSYTWNKLVKKELFDKLNKTFIEGVNFWEDVSTVPKLIHSAKKISHLKLPLYHYVRDNINSYTKTWYHKYTLNILDVLKLNIEYFKDKEVNIHPLIVRGISLILEKESFKPDKELKKNIKVLLPTKINYSNIKSKKRRLNFWLYKHNLGFLIPLIKGI